MSRRHPRSSLPRRQLRRESDRTLYDLNERRRVEMSELCDDVRSGRYFRVIRHTSGEDCTQEVLAEVLLAGVPKPGTSGVGTFASMVSNVMTGLIGGIGTGGDELSLREKRPTRPSRSAGSSLGVGSDDGQPSKRRATRGATAGAPVGGPPAVGDAPPASEERVHEERVHEERRARRAGHKSPAVPDAGDGSGNGEQRPRRGSPKGAQSPDRREWWEGD